MCSGVDVDVDGVTAARDISSPRGETDRCGTSVVGVMEVGLERGELGVGSAINGDIEQLVDRGEGV